MLLRGSKLRILLLQLKILETHQELSWEMEAFYLTINEKELCVFAKIDLWPKN